MPPRFFVDQPLHTGLDLALASEVARHVQVLRLQPGDPITLFNGAGGEWHAAVTRMARQGVDVQVREHVPVERELGLQVTLALGMPANDRMDALVEKATELGVAVLQPLVCERSVLRLHGERADKKVAHWRAVATAASEQCGRTAVPAVAPVRSLADWLRSLGAADEVSLRHVLSLREARPLATVAVGKAIVFLSGPEGGLTPDEETAALAQGFTAVTLGTRVLRADTAPLAALAIVGAWR